MLKSSLFKWIVAIGSVSVLTLVAGSAGAGFILFPLVPKITKWDLNPNFGCFPTMEFIDRSTNEDGFKVFFRPQGAKNFSLIAVLPARASKGSTYSYKMSPPLAGGLFEYKVTAFNSYGEASDTISVDAAPGCSDVPSLLPGDPMKILVNPLLISATLVDRCNIQIEFEDFNTVNIVEEDGINIRRSTDGVTWEMIKTLPPAGVGTYLDAKLAPDTYLYEVSAYKDNLYYIGDHVDVYSGISAPISVDDSCNSSVAPLPPTEVFLPPPPSEPKQLSCTWEAAANVFLRKGPDVGLFDRLTDMQSGQTLPIIGQSEDAQFWAVEVSPGVIGYITKSEKYSRISGDCADVPTLTDPEPPEAAPIPTKKPGDPASPAAACSDGVDNDGDGLVDYNPFGSGDPDCSTADDNSE